MGRLVDTDDLVTASDIARRIGTSSALIRLWSIRYDDMPAAVAHINVDGRTRVWLWSEMEPWLINNGVINARHTATMPDNDAPVDIRELLTATDVARLVGWKSSGTAMSLVKRGHFPKPVTTIGRTRLWARTDVEHWMATAPRKNRRP